MLRCLECKRRADVWALAPYISADDPEVKRVRSDFDLLHFTPKVEILDALFNEPKKRVECTDFWNAIWRSAHADGATSRARRNVIVYNLADTPKPADYEELVQLVAVSYDSLQVISAVPSAALEEFCGRTGGTFQVATDAGVAELIEQAYTNLMTRYEVEYQLIAPEVRSLKLRVCAPNGFAEASVAIPLNR